MPLFARCTTDSLEDGIFLVYPFEFSDDDMLLLPTVYAVTVLAKLTKLTFILLSDFRMADAFYRPPVLARLSTSEPHVCNILCWNFPPHMYRQLHGIHRLMIGGHILTPKIVDIIRCASPIGRLRS